MPLTIAIVGRPNVGKSTLFNRLVGKRLAIVHDTPGVTRDRRIAEATLGHLTLNIVDTAGFETGAPESLPSRMTDQTKLAIADADICLFLVDARAGITAGDEIIAETLRRSGKRVVLAANKAEGRSINLATNEAYALGFGEPIPLSAEHGIGLADLIEVLAPLAEPLADETENAQAPPGEEEFSEEELAKRPLRLAIVGRPNVGKSSLFNKLLGEERALVSPEAGTTRDAVIAEWLVDGREILLHDTAGLRRKARTAGEDIEKLSIGSTLNAIRYADCVIIMIDATAPFEKQDLTIADLIAREGRAIVFAINKWDLLEDRAGAIGQFRERIDHLLPQVAGAPLIGTSARTGEGLNRLLPAVLEADKIWNTRVSTGALNRFLTGILERHPPPAVHGRRVRIRYMTQIKTRPPHFGLFGNQLDALPDSYVRYLQNMIRETFGLKGTPIRFSMRNSKNPFAPE
ncbi:MAG TPA: ribosome biogenesis GTPase Der [Rhizomicrobium sp.]|jgi:GTP-binding protein|nr:ribosome biogenesis GTPase Der [Rhizomicrobium sp.]